MAWGGAGLGAAAGGALAGGAMAPATAGRGRGSTPPLAAGTVRVIERERERERRIGLREGERGRG